MQHHFSDFTFIPMVLAMLLAAAPNAVLAAAENSVALGKHSVKEQHQLTLPSTTAHSNPRSKLHKTKSDGASASQNPPVHSSLEEGAPAPDRPSGPGA